MVGTTGKLALRTIAVPSFSADLGAVLRRPASRSARSSCSRACCSNNRILRLAGIMSATTRTWIPSTAQRTGTTSAKARPRRTNPASGNRTPTTVSLGQRGSLVSLAERTYIVCPAGGLYSSTIQMLRRFLGRLVEKRESKTPASESTAHSRMARNTASAIQMSLDIAY